MAKLWLEDKVGRDGLVEKRTYRLEAEVAHRAYTTPLTTNGLTLHVAYYMTYVGHILSVFVSSVLDHGRTFQLT